MYYFKYKYENFENFEVYILYHFVFIIIIFLILRIPCSTQHGNDGRVAPKRVTESENSLTFFELFEQYVERGVFEYEITRVLVELAQSFKQCVIVRIDQRQVLDVQHGDDVLMVSFVHGYSRVSCETAKHNIMKQIKFRKIVRTLLI